ncbi:MAG: hypothetical protein A3I66_02635 [Burkholderiales bacterium RIFCSPLOWO2_02_FULL_57_36]|nr:MAG: hypothetical protein A3I66_02635 [Burkholderiales bacterium RIFCSPLOWO2_02_FULL_57_36]
MKQQSANTPPETADGGPKKPSVNKPAPLPTVGAPLDGSQFQNIVEEQKYSEQRPTREEQQPRHAGSDKAH